MRPIPYVQAAHYLSTAIRDFMEGPIRLLDFRPMDDGSVEQTSRTFLQNVVEEHVDWADHRFAFLVREMPPEGSAALLLRAGVQEQGANAHKMILPVQSWLFLSQVGWGYAPHLLRASVRFVSNYPKRPEGFEVAQGTIEQFRLLHAPLRETTDRDEDRAVASLRRGILESRPATAARRVARALVRGLSLEGAAEAFSLAATDLYLQVDPTYGEVGPVHITTAANSLRFVARCPFVGRETQLLALLQASYQVARRQEFERHGGHMMPERLPRTEDIEQVRQETPPDAVGALGSAISANDVRRATALAAWYGEQGNDAGPVLSLLDRIACTDDATIMHALKQTQAMREEFERTRPAFKWTHLTAAVKFASWFHGRGINTYKHASALLGLP